MTIHYYILPIEQITQPDGSISRGAKYFRWQKGGTGIVCPFAMTDYGSINEAIVVADISDVDHAALSANSDVYSFPVGLDATMTVTERSAANTFFETVGIPGDWLAQGDTFRSVLRTVTQMFLYIICVTALMGYPVDPTAGLTLNTQYRNIPNPLHDALHTGATSLGYTWAIANNDQIRKIWKLMADQWGSTPIDMGLGQTL